MAILLSSSSSKWLWSRNSGKIIGVSSFFNEKRTDTNNPLLAAFKRFGRLSLEEFARVPVLPPPNLSLESGEVCLVDTGLARLRVVCPSSDGDDHGDDCFATHPRPGGFARSGPVCSFRDEKGKKKKRGRCAPSQETSHDDRAWPNPPDDRSSQKAIPNPEPFAVQGLRITIG